MNERKRFTRIRETFIEQGETLLDKLPSRTYALPVIGSWLIDRSYRRGVSKAQKLLDSMTIGRQRDTEAGVI